MPEEPILIIPSLVRTSDFGGITHQIELIQHLSKIFKISLVRMKSAPLDKVVLPEIKGDNVTTGMRLKYAWHAYSSGKKLAIDNNVKLIYARHGLATIPAIKIGRKLNKPVVLEVNGILSDEEKSTWLLRKIDRDCSKHAARIIAVTEGIKKHLVDNYDAEPDKIKVIANGANTNHFKPMEKEEVRAKLGLGHGNLVIYIGNLESWQGVETIIDSAPEVLKEQPDTKFLICGSGSMKRDLEKQTKELGLDNTVKFTGPISYKEVPLYMNAGDICLVPKKPLKSGYSPLKLYEYMACGRPVIASNLPGFEIIEENNTGILIPPEDKEALARNILKLLNEPDLRKQMGHNGRILVEEKYSWKNVADRVANICANTIDKHSK